MQIPSHIQAFRAVCLAAAVVFGIFSAGFLAGAVYGFILAGGGHG